jgi:protein SCO1
MARAIGRRSYADKKVNEPFHRSGHKETFGVFSPAAAALFVITGGCLFYYFNLEKARIQEERRKAQAPKKIGRAFVGGPFSLVTHTGEPFTEKDLLGKWSLIYFGFTNCPDICPDELDKMGQVVEEIKRRHPGPDSLGQTLDILPVFISVDPARDDLPAMKRYVDGECSSLSARMWLHCVSFRNPRFSHSYTLSQIFIHK